MFGKIARVALIVTPALALMACGSSHEEEMAKQLSEAKATAIEEAAARKAAEREAAALRARAHDAALADFYANEGGDEAEPAPDADQPADAGEPPADDAPPSNPGAPQPVAAGA
ncbi:hypothetical protein SAMN05518801_11626 [Novosphingobium sp. CF614]|uniref:hypothetical protein n=1 Tax=Novosphingobium sp. CF614 TaxID=1884364 RepID=UPI0008E3D53F|nr:hypothetical protein [Novosphingobium sp. CF614]SFG31811.1 hypothetical protein SAMN05518801_11626 [Novosphingobium sp. CF614]